MTSIGSMNKEWYGLRAYNATDKSVFLVEDKEELLMGPYTTKKGVDNAKINGTIDKYKVMKKLGLKYIPVLKDNDNSGYLRFDDFTKEYTINRKGSKQDNIGTYIANILEITNFKIICDVESYNWIYDQLEDLLVTLVWLWIFNTPIQLYNVFVDKVKKTFWIVDIDRDKDSVNKNDNLFFLTRNPNVKCKFFDRAGQHYDKVAGRVDTMRSRLKLGDNLRAKAKEAVKKLRDNYLVWRSIQPGGEGVLLPKGAQLHGEPSRPLVGKEPIYGVPLPGDDLGNMKVLKESAVTYSGIEYSTGLRYLEYYIRQGVREKAIMLAVELLHVRDAEVYGRMVRGYGNYASFIRSLKIFIATDINIANYGLTLALIDFLNRFGDSLTYVELISIIIAMLDSLKMRTFAQKYIMASTEKCGVDYEYKYYKGEEESMKELRNDKKFMTLLSDAEDEKIIDMLLHFYVSLTGEGSDTYIVVIRKFETMFDKKHSIKRKHVAYVDTNGNDQETSHPYVLLWDVLDYDYNDKVGLNILRRAFFTHYKHNIQFLVLAAAARVYGFRYESYKLRFEEADPMRYYMLSRYKLELDENYKTRKEKETIEKKKVALFKDKVLDDNISNTTIQYFKCMK